MSEKLRCKQKSLSLHVQACRNKFPSIGCMVRNPDVGFCFPPEHKALLQSCQQPRCQSRFFAQPEAAKEGPRDGSMSARRVCESRVRCAQFAFARPVAFPKTPEPVAPPFSPGSTLNTFQCLALQPGGAQARSAASRDSTLKPPVPCKTWSAWRPGLWPICCKTDLVTLFVSYEISMRAFMYITYIYIYIYIYMYIYVYLFMYIFICIYVYLCIFYLSMRGFWEGGGTIYIYISYAWPNPSLGPLLGLHTAAHGLRALFEQVIGQKGAKALQRKKRKSPC